MALSMRFDAFICNDFMFFKAHYAYLHLEVFYVFFNNIIFN